MAREIMALGFQRLELSHGLRAPLAAELLKAQDELGFEVSSVHAFCPQPPEVLSDSPDCYMWTSHREEERRRATRLALATVEMAARCGARAVVLHCGKIRSQSASERLRARVNSGEWGTKVYAKEKLKAVVRREATGPLYLERVIEGMRPVVEAAERLGLALGIENREDYEAVPSEREMPELLERLGSRAVFAWHDFGHAQIKQHLGFIDHGQYLDELGPRVFGAHLHDVKWPFHDHRPPFTGTVPFEKLLPKLSHCQEFVFEIHPRFTREEILAARERWLQLFSP